MEKINWNDFDWEEEEPSIFKVGDRVRCVIRDSCFLKYGSIYIVKEVYYRNFIRVEIGYTYHSNDFELV